MSGQSFWRPLALASIVWASACSDSTQPHDKGSADAERIRKGVLVSAPIVSRSGASASGDVVDAPVVFVSMPPGTLADGDSVRITPTNGQSVSEAMGDGGFDPVPVTARTGDSLEVAVYVRGAANRVRLGISALRQPSVVRTTPARGRTDVPLNQRIVIVFSQPLSGATVTPTSISLTLDGAAVPANLTLEPGQSWVVLLSPTTPLSPSATYHVSVATSVADANGAALNAAYSTEFTTGTTPGSVASLGVSAPDGFNHSRDLSAAIASPGGTAEFIAQELSEGGDTLVNSGIVWSTTDPAVATVVASGIGDAIATVSALSPGQVSVTACAGTICGQGELSVKVPSTGLAPTVELGDLGGGDSRVWDMKGDFVGGSSSLAGGACAHAFIWSGARGMEDLGALPGQCNSTLTMMNDSGASFGLGDVDPHGIWSQWIWTRATGMRPLPLPDTLKDWQAVTINARGEIAYSSSTGPINILGTDGHFRIMAASLPNASILDLNDRDHALLTTPDPGTNSCGVIAYIWDATTDREIQTLSGSDSTGAALHFCPYFINNTDVVAGFVFTPRNELQAFRWTAAGGFAFLHVSPGETSETAKLNENGDVSIYLRSYPHVGTDSITQVDAAIWRADGTLVRLSGLGGNHTTANGLGNSNIVAGHSQSGSNTGSLHAVLWDLDGVTTAQITRAAAKPSARAARAAYSAVSAGRPPVPPNAMSPRPHKY